MGEIMPKARPRLSSTDLNNLLLPYGLDRNDYPLLIVGIRGYYLSTMGKQKENDRGIYDDAIFIDTPNGTVSFNANTDSSRIRIGFGRLQKTKGMAMLKPGLWISYQFGNHKTYPALIQTGGEVTVTRDGNPNYDDTGYFGINIHKGGMNTTCSDGCQTIPPTQWTAFIGLVTSEGRRLFKEKISVTKIPYLLLENTGQL